MKKLGILLLAVSNLLLSQKFQSEKLTTHIFIRYHDQIIKGENSSSSLDIDIGQKTIQAELNITEFSFQEKIRTNTFGKDFMEVSKFPKAYFEGTLLQKSGNNYLVMGIITIHGIQYSINFPAQIKYINNLLTIDGSFLLRYADFDIRIPQKESKKIKNQIKISIQGKLQN